MDNKLIEYESSDISLEIFRIFLTFCYAAIIIVSIYRIYITSKEFNSPNSELINFILICIILGCLSNLYLGIITAFFLHHISIPTSAAKIIAFIPCALFTIVVTRITYLVIGIFLSLYQDFEIEQKETIEKFCKILLTFYCFVNVFARLIVVCIGDADWMIDGSVSQTLGFLSIFFSVTSVVLICVSVGLTYFQVKKVMRNSLGKSINKNLQIFACVLLFIILCYWASSVIGMYCFIGNAKEK